MEDNTSKPQITKEQILSLEEEKKLAEKKVEELEQALVRARSLFKEINTDLDYAKSAHENENTKKDSSADSAKDSKQEDIKGTNKPAETKSATPENKKSKKAKASEGKNNVESNKLKTFAYSSKVRSKGKAVAKEINTPRKSSSEVFIYIVEDSPLQLKTLQEQFKNTKSFKSTKGFETGEKCFEYIKSHKYSKKSIIIVISDYFLETSEENGNMNGIELLVNLKEYDPCIDVIMLSSHEDIDLATSASRYGVSSYIIKGPAAMKKILSNIQLIIKDREAVRKKASSQKALRGLILGFFAVIVALLVIDATVAKGKLNIAFWVDKEIAGPAKTEQPTEKVPETIENATPADPVSEDEITE